MLVADHHLRVGIDGRILALPQVRGLTRYTVNLLRAMSTRSDVSLHLICREPPHPAHLEGIRAEVTYAPASREFRWASVTLPRAIREAEVDVFHAPADRGLPARMAVPSVVTVHGSYERSAWRACHPTAKGRAWYWANEAVNWLAADRLVTVSQTTAEQLLALRVARPGRVRVVPSAAAPEFTPTPEPEDAQVLTRHGITDPYLLFVGGYDSNKNVEVVVEAFLSLRRGPLLLVVVADHQYRHDRMSREWSRREGSEHLLLLEVSPCDLPAIYRSAVAAVVASHSESFSFPAVEALASGTPLIASTGTAVAEVAGDAPRYFDPHSARDLARAIAQLLDDDTLRREMVERGLDRVKGLSWDRTAAGTIAVYREIAG